MAMPNRHYAISGFSGLLISATVGSWYGLLIGIVVAFITHPWLDIVFNEHWDMTSAQKWKYTIILGPLLCMLAIVYGVVFGLGNMIMFFIACMLPDIIDEGLSTINKDPIFFFHKYEFKEKWALVFPEETFKRTFVLEILACVLVIILSLLTTGLHNINFVRV